MEHYGKYIDNLMTPEEVANALGVSQETLKRWRKEMRGPKWLKLGNSRTSPIRYPCTLVTEHMNSLTIKPAP